MNVKKLSSEEVPQAFLEWLLSMGCPADVVPSVDKMLLLCRGQYSMVWKSMMEHISSKNNIMDKRLQVFIDDISKCKEMSPFSERTQSVIEPLQLTLWKQKVEGKKKLLEIETRISQVHNELKILNKISSLLTQKKILSIKVENLQRHSWLLQQVISELECKKKHLEETRVIAKSLCSINASDDLENKLEMCMGLIKRNMTAQGNTYVASTHETDSEEMLESLVKCRGDVVWQLLNERRASSVRQLEAAHGKRRESVATDVGEVEALVAHTARLQSSLALQSVKNRQHVKQAQKQLAAQLELLGARGSAEACELLVLKSELCWARAKLAALKELGDDVAHARGVFALAEPAACDARSRARLVARADHDIESKRNDIMKHLGAQEATEHKIGSVQACLATVFGAFHANSDRDTCQGVQFNFPPEPVAALHKFFSELRQSEASGARLSLRFDASHSITDQPTFSDELNVYLQTFDLEKNRKILLKSGEKMWVSDTLKWSTARLQQQWLRDDVTPLLCPSSGLKHNLEQIASDVEEVEGLQAIAKRLQSADASSVRDMDIRDQSAADEIHKDNIKKRIAENLAILEKTKKHLDIAEENLNFWARAEMNRFISTTRTIDAKTYADYESLYSKAILKK